MAIAHPTNIAYAPTRSLLNWIVWGHFAAYYRDSWRRLAFYAAVSALQSLLVVPMLLLIRRAFDVAIPTGNIELLILIGAGIFGIRVASAGISLWLRAVHLKITKAAITEIRESLLRKLYSFSRAVYTEMDRDQVHARLVQDTERIDNMTNVLLSTVIPALLTSLFLVGVLLILNPYLMLILVAMLPMLLVAGLISGRSVKSGVVIFQRAFETFSKGTLFALHHIELTQIQSSEATELRRQVGYLDNLRSTGESMGLRFAIHGQLQRTLTGLAIVALLVAGGTSVALGTMTLGEFLAFYVAAGLLNTYVNNALTALPQIITGNESMVTLYKLSTTDSAQPYTGTRRIDFEGRISVRSVFFSYGDERILENVDLELRPGTTTALVGSNGAGKSTLAHLILGLYRPSRGQLFADGIAYDELNISELRRNIGVVPQHPELFAGTIEENLCYGADGVGHKEAVQAARTVLIDDFVRSLPKGYDTEIGADGVLLSGGQCQRLALARALIREPTLLILDEPTNHLDAETIELVLKNIQCLRHRPAILLISHDSSVVSAADQVFALREGMFVEQPEPLSNCERQTA